ncbi:hypothetical protein O181_003334 [Austropuccinia psidii MF-1]|uniref:Uncharacterized protein n=1 Tax=Austropuccinia psidii MF-1 TaxID=1389203 RepID=A0A9Q3BDY1_9BASI|nr:hypothetical protein [Austropuccinia psidii MF-1]
MHMCYLAWNAITPGTISNFWDHTKIVPKIDLLPHDFGAVQAEASLEEVTAPPQDVFLFTSCNQMYISELLKLSNEYVFNHGLISEEIFNDKTYNTQDLEEIHANEREFPIPPISEVKKEI